MIQNLNSIIRRIMIANLVYSYRVCLSPQCSATETTLTVRTPSRTLNIQVVKAIPNSPPWVKASTLFTTLRTPAFV
jgi:hypothetical protein